jgi:hypothetical protein
MSLVAQTLKKVLKKRAEKLKEEELEKTPQVQVSADQQQSLITPVQKRNYTYNINLEIPFESPNDFTLTYKFNAYLSRNEKNALDELIKEIKQIFIGNFGNSGVIKDRLEKMYKLLQSKINEYSLDFVRALKSLFDGLIFTIDKKGNTVLRSKTRPSGSSQKTYEGLYILLSGGENAETKLASSYYQQILNLINNRLNKAQIEQEPETMETLQASIAMMPPTVNQPSYGEVGLTPEQTTAVELEKVRLGKERELLKKGKKKIVVRKIAEELKKQEAERLAREEAERLAREKKLRESTVVQQEIPEGYSQLLGLGLNKTQKMEDLFGVLPPQVLKGKGKKMMKANLIKALLGDGLKIKKVVKQNDARRVRGLKVKEIMKNEGLSLAEASKKLKMMKK